MVAQMGGDDGVQLSLPEAVREILSRSAEPLTPLQIRERIKAEYPHLYGTPTQQLNVQRGNYRDLNHALLAGIYAVVKGVDFILDRTNRPLRVSLANAGAAEEEAIDEPVGEDFDAETGVVYVLSTNLMTRANRHIIKIGQTTQPIETRINQLYTTGTPLRFEVMHQWNTKNYIELERALHQLLAPYRINPQREFFTEDALPFVEPIVRIHLDVQQGADRG